MLIEREVEFASKFRIRCEFCRAGNWLTAEDYVGSAESMMNCTSCGDEFNFGPALIELTDAEDRPSTTLSCRGSPGTTRAPSRNGRA
jgi:hypothetical protein